MGKRIVGYVISHSGKPGGPWESNRGTGLPAVNKREDRYVGSSLDNARHWLPSVRAIHPAARILRLVRRERHRAEEAAVVEAAMAWECARKPLLVVTQLRDDERIRLVQSQLDTSVALERAVRVLLLAKRGG